VQQHVSIEDVLGDADELKAQNDEMSRELLAARTMTLLQNVLATQARPLVLSLSLSLSPFTCTHAYARMITLHFFPVARALSCSCSRFRAHLLVPALAQSHFLCRSSAHSLAHPPAHSLIFACLRLIRTSTYR
jgi:hypothetical protein